MIKELVVATAFLFSGGYAAADTYLAFGTSKYEFTGVTELREKGHTVQLLYVDMTEKILGIHNALMAKKLEGMSKEERIAETKKAFDEAETEIFEKTIKTDMATRVLAKKLGLKKVPAVVMVRDDESMVALYGSTDLIKTTKKLREH